MAEVSIRLATLADVAALCDLCSEVHALHLAHRPDQFKPHPERFRITEFSVLGEDIFLIVEAQSPTALVEGIRGASIRPARTVSVLLGTKGRFFASRWQERALETRRAVRDALVTVFGNFRKQPRAAALLDVYSSAPYFRDFIEFNGSAPLELDPKLIPRALAPPPAPPVSRAKTRLLTSDWKRHGKLSVSETE